MKSERQHHLNRAPVCNVDIYSDGNIEHPVPAYHQMLSIGPIVWLEPLGMQAIVGFEALTAALRNHRVFRSGAGVSINEDVNKFLIGSTLNSDPPQHDVTRAITFSPLSPKALEGVRPLIQREAERLADHVMSLGECDAAQTLAPYLPMTIVRDLVGLGAHGKEQMLDWAAATFELMGDPRDRRKTALENLRSLRSFLDDPETLSRLDPDGWAQHATQRGLEKGIAPDKATELMRDYIAPSLDTMISAIGYAIMLFAQNPDAWTKLRSDRSLVGNAIEEVVRLNTPIKMFSRLVADPIEVSGVPLKAGERVLMVFGAANRDASRFADPDRFDIARNTRGHLGFGHGVHACLGMHLARLEMSCLFNALADRVARIELAGDIVPARNSTIHAFKSIPIRFVAAG